MRIEELLHDRQRQQDEAPMLVDGDVLLTYPAIDLMSARMAAALAANGILRGDRVVVFMDESWQAIISMVAILKAGAIIVPVDPSATSPDLAATLNGCEAAGLVTQSRLARVSVGAMAASPGLRLTVIAGCEGSPEIDGIRRFEDAIAGPLEEADAPAPGEASDPALLARPPAVARLTLTHADIVAAAASMTTPAAKDTPPIALERSFYRFIAAAQRGTALVLKKSEGTMQAAE